MQGADPNRLLPAAELFDCAQIKPVKVMSRAR
jgi:hypothetical protein